MPSRSSRLHEGLHEGMTRSAGRRRGGRAALAALLAALLLLALGWAALSALGGDHEARAQSSGEDSGELAQAAPEDSAEDGSGGGSEPSYEAFGEPRNPFALVVEPAEEAEESTPEDQPEGDATTQAGDDNASDTTSGDDTTSSQDNGSGDNGGARQPFGSPAPGGQNPDPPRRNTQQSTQEIITGPNGERVDCGNPADEFERIICEEERRGGFSAGGGEAGSGGQGPPGSGGSGRSGVGEPAEEFRNGGGGFVK